MDATSAQGPRERLLHPGQEELTELDKMISTCAVDAKLSKAQWDELLEKVGAEKIEDLLELDAEDYDTCLFKPLMKRRLEEFQSNLYDKHWSKQKGNRDEADVPARGSGDAEPAAPPPPAPARARAGGGGAGIRAGDPSWQKRVASVVPTFFFTPSFGKLRYPWRTGASSFSDKLKSKSP